MTFYVVIGVEGEYSDREEYVAGIFTDKKIACHLIEEKSAFGRQRALEISEWHRKRGQLREDLTKQKLAQMVPELRAYYAYPLDHIDLTQAEEDSIRDQVGPLPQSIQYGYYYLVSVPLNQWGKWNQLYAEEIG